MKLGKKKEESKHFIRALELKDLILITQGQVRNHTVLVNQPLPKHKQSKFDKLLTQVKNKLLDLDIELDELFAKKLTNDEINRLLLTEGVKI